MTPNGRKTAKPYKMGDSGGLYRELFRYDLEPGMVDEIRRATNGNFALGNERFAAQVAEMIGRRASLGQSGRPRNSAVGEAGELPF